MNALDLYRKSPALYRAYAAVKGRQVDRKIREEQRHYERIRPVAPEPPEVRARLRERIGRRGIVPVPKRPADVHVFYATRPNIWEVHNLPPELSARYDLTTYFYAERGFDDGRADWVEVRAGLDRDLLETVRAVHEKKPVDLFLGYLSGWQVAPETIRAIGDLGIVTSAYCWDDKPSFRGALAGGRFRGPAALASSYDLNLTNAPSSIVKYEVEGGLALFWPEGGNPEHFRPLDRPFLHDVSFVGACYGIRPLLVDHLRKNGIDVAAFGPGWEGGPVSEEEMVEVYSRSRINLGVGGIGYSTRNSCLKGRDFEVPMCGAFYLTSHNPELGRVYDLGREIATYRTTGECLDRVRHYLACPEEREAVAAAGRARCLAEHTWGRRLDDLLEFVGFLHPPRGG
jgi:hypothetical protein